MSRGKRNAFLCFRFLWALLADGWMEWLPLQSTLPPSPRGRGRGGMGVAPPSPRGRGLGGWVSAAGVFWRPVPAPSRAYKLAANAGHMHAQIQARLRGAPFLQGRQKVKGARSALARRALPAAALYFLAAAVIGGAAGPDCFAAHLFRLLLCAAKTSDTVLGFCK